MSNIDDKELLALVRKSAGDEEKLKKEDTQILAHWLYEFINSDRYIGSAIIDSKLNHIGQQIEMIMGLSKGHGKEKIERALCLYAAEVFCYLKEVSPFVGDQKKRSLRDWE